MKIKTKIVGDNILYQLDGWESDDWLTCHEFVKELYESEANYEVIPNLKLKQGKMK